MISRNCLTAVLVIIALVAMVSVVTAEEITIVGTGDGVTVLNAVGDAFSKENPGVTVVVPKSIGSGGGVKAVGNGQYLIARVAREIKDKEKHFGLSYIPYAKIPVVFFVNKSVDVDNITARQACDIYSGKITNWSDLGGKDSKIRVVRREDGDSSLKVLKKNFPGFKDITITNKSKTANSTPENFSIVEKKAGTIGFGPYDLALSKDVKVLKIDGVTPTDKNYSSIGTMGFVFKEKNKTGTIQQFIDFLKSPASLKAIIKAGGMPADH